jgi:hypothetical protein
VAPVCGRKSSSPSTSAPTAARANHEPDPDGSSGHPPCRPSASCGGASAPGRSPAAARGFGRTPTKRGTAMSIDEDTVTTIGTRSQPVVDVGRGAGSRSCARTRGRCESNRNGRSPDPRRGDRRFRSRFRVARSRRGSARRAGRRG